MAAINSRRLDDVELKIYAADIEAPENGNVDVELIERDGTRWSATFFTLGSLEALLLKGAITGEGAGGTYVWASDMIVVRALSITVIEATVRDLRSCGEFTSAFHLLDDD